MSQTRGCLVLALTAALASCTTAPKRPPQAGVPAPAVVRDTHERLQGVLWVQTSAEFDVLSRVLYRQATESLEPALADPTWTAALEQTGDFARLPPAVVLDLDETVLDNSAFEGRLVADRTTYSSKLWGEWVLRSGAGVLPGTAEFLSAAEGRSVTIFYVTNREAAQEKDTLANLIRLGLPVDPAGARILSKSEKPEWGSDKSSRRAEIAASYRILLLIGDDLGDFVSGVRDLPEKRVQLARRHAAMWGRRWFLLPNPLYGSWDSALYGHDSTLSDAEILERKRGQVKAY